MHGGKGWGWGHAARPALGRLAETGGALNFGRLPGPRMTLLLTFPCRRCGAAVDAGAKATLLAQSPRVLLDCACAACGHRALYGAA